MVITKYGQLSNDSICKHIKYLINRTWNLLKLKEESCTTLNACIERLNRELFGFFSFTGIHDGSIIRIASLLENALYENDYQRYRADILKCVSLLDELHMVYKNKVGDL